MAQASDYFSPAQLARAQEMAQRAIGKHTKVRTDEGVQHGVIDTCEVVTDRVSFRGRKVELIWSVDMLCGVNQRRRNFKLVSLPQ